MKTFQISEFKKGDFIIKMDKVSRKAEKLGIEFGYKLTGSHEESVSSRDGMKLFYTVYEYSVWGESPTINGYTFLAKIEPFDGGNLVHTHNTEIDFSEYRDSNSLICEHCNTNRYRKFYYVISNGTETKVVGHNCLANYIGIPNAEQVALFYSSFVVDQSSFDGDDDVEADFKDRVVGGQYTFAVDDFLTFAVHVINEYGYVSAKNEDWQTGKLSTRSRTIELFYYSGKDSFKPTDKDLQSARDMMEFVRNELESKTTGLTEYEANILRFITANRMTHNHAGYVVSIIPLYNRLQGVVYEKKNTAVSQHVGSVGDKLENVPAKVTYTSKFPSPFGTTYLYKFDAGGNVVVYFSSKDLSMETGQDVTITKATIKGHDSFNNVKQTIITRGKVEVNQNENQ
jgi:hypothetical protein